MLSSFSSLSAQPRLPVPANNAAASPTCSSQKCFATEDGRRGSRARASQAEGPASCCRAGRGWARHALPTAIGGGPTGASRLRPALSLPLRCNRRTQARPQKPPAGRLRKAPAKGKPLTVPHLVPHLTLPLSTPFPSGSLIVTAGALSR